MKTLIAIPCMDMVYTSFMKAMLALIQVGETQVGITCSSLIYDARNRLAGKALGEGYDRVLWLDSDMAFDPGLLVRLSKDLDEGREMVCGLFFRRKPPFTPVIYKEFDYGMEGIGPQITLEPYLDYPQNEIFPVAGCGFGAVLMNTSLIDRVGDKFGHPFAPITGLGEDLSFCWRVKQLGVEMFCDSRIKVGHVGFGTITEETFLSTR